MKNMRRLEVLASHINGREEPLWVHLMDSGYDSVAKPQFGCRCSSDKWRYVCSCYPCLRWAGREHEFDWTPAAIQAQPQSIPPQWKFKSFETSIRLDPLACAGKTNLPRPSPEKGEELVTEEVGGIPRMRLPNGPYGPVAISGLPRFAGIATFARLPQLQEIQSAQGSSEAVLWLRRSAAKDCSKLSDVSIRLGSICQILAGEGEVSLAVSPEDGNLHIEVAGEKYSSVALWTLPQNSWHRQRFVNKTKGSLSLELDLKLKKTLQKLDIALVGVPFDSGCSFRPGARFGPEAIRSNSRLTRPYLIAQQQRPLQERPGIGRMDIPPAKQGLLAKEGSTHIGIRATTYSAEDFHDSDAMGIATLTAEASIFKLKTRLNAAQRKL
eukprot:Skav229653  [mRNA]  locus=scaffold649:423436:425176:- [translate_table: standard]